MQVNKTIYIIRHGETDYNKNGIIQGSGVDSDLNSTGRNQAQQFYKAYHHKSFDKIYTSDLKRTKQSVSPFKESGFEIEAISELNEINWGFFEGLKGTPDSQRVYNGIINDWRAGLLDRSVEGGESPNQMQKRQKLGLEKIMKRTDEKLILICMHGRALRSFLCLLTGTPLERMDEFKHSNLSLYVLEHQENNFKIVERNNTSHLWI